MAKKSSTRAHASFFQMATHERTEFGVASKLLESMSLIGQEWFSDLQVFKPDPPDCVARDTSGGLVGFEVTEVVSREAIEENLVRRRRRLTSKASADDPANGHCYWDWTPEAFVQAVSRRVHEKDVHAFNGGPYSQRILLMHNAEVIISPDEIETEFRRTRPPLVQQFDSAFLHCLYDGGIGRCPFIQIPLQRATTSG